MSLAVPLRYVEFRRAITSPPSSPYVTENSWQFGPTCSLSAAAGWDGTVMLLQNRKWSGGGDCTHYSPPARTLVSLARFTPPISVCARQSKRCVVEQKRNKRDDHDNRKYIKNRLNQTEARPNNRNESKRNQFRREPKIDRKGRSWWSSSWSSGWQTVQSSLCEFLPCLMAVP